MMTTIQFAVKMAVARTGYEKSENKYNTDAAIKSENSDSKTKRKSCKVENVLETVYCKRQLCNSNCAPAFVHANVHGTTLFILLNRRVTHTEDVWKRVYLFVFLCERIASGLTQQFNNT